MLGLSPLSMSSSTPGIQTIRWVTSSPRRFLTYTGHIPTSKAAAARSSRRTCKARRAAIAGADLQLAGPPLTRERDARPRHSTEHVQREREDPANDLTKSY